MFTRLRRLALILTLVVLPTACKNPLHSTGSQGMGEVTGQVTAPPAQISAIGGFEAYRIAGFAGEVPVGGDVEVRALALDGEPIPTASARTDGEGRFHLKGVPLGQVSIVKATVTGKNGKSLTITGLVKPSDPAVVTDVSGASTVVAQGLMKLGLSAKARLVSQAILEQVVATLAGVATELERNPDLSGEADLSLVFQSVLARTTALRGLVESIVKAED